jgi:hypothetical protein
LPRTNQASLPATGGDHNEPAGKLQKDPGGIISEGVFTVTGRI